MSEQHNTSMSNIYQPDGRVPLAKAIPFGLQHVLAMFVANLTPIIIVTASAGLETNILWRRIQRQLWLCYPCMLHLV